MVLNSICSLDYCQRTHRYCLQLELFNFIRIHRLQSVAQSVQCLTESVGPRFDSCHGCLTCVLFDCFLFHFFSPASLINKKKAFVEPPVLSDDFSKCKNPKFYFFDKTICFIIFFSMYVQCLIIRKKFHFFIVSSFVIYGLKMKAENIASSARQLTF